MIHFGGLKYIKIDKKKIDNEYKYRILKRKWEDLLNKDFTKITINNEIIVVHRNISKDNGIELQDMNIEIKNILKIKNKTKDNETLYDIKLE